MSIHTEDFGLAPGAAMPPPLSPAPAPPARLIAATSASRSEEALERALRPKLLQEYVGQSKAREQLEIFIGAAKKRSAICRPLCVRTICCAINLASPWR